MADHPVQEARATAASTPTAVSDPASPSTSSVLIVIVNYRTPGLVIDCLRSLESDWAALPDARAVVVDNDSGDDSTQRLAAAIDEHGWASRVTLMPLDHNGGFSVGNNAAIDAAMASENPPDCFLLLNSDTYIRPGAVVELLHAIEADASVGIVGARLEWPDGRPQRSCFNFMALRHALLRAGGTSLLTRLLPRPDLALPCADEPVSPDWVSFACAMIRRPVVEQIGTLDEGYFLYFDDIDYCRRARSAGWSVRYHPAARVVHLRGQSGPVKKATVQLKRRPRYYYASRSRYYAKFYGRAGLWCANLLWMLGRCISLPRELVRHKRPHLCRHEMFDNWTNATRPMRMPDAPKEGDSG